MRWQSRIRSWAREPLVQMLVAGLVVALIASATTPDYDPEGSEIVVSETAVSTMIEQFQRTWQRMPNERELDSLIASYVREEALVREAQRLGLDQDDQIVRRRLASKMESVLMAEGETAQPSDAQLKAYYDKNWRRYAPPQSVSFDQIYLGELEEGPAQQKAAALQSQLKSGADWQGLGEPLLIEQSYDDAELERINREIGGAFVAELPSAPLGAWSGPIRSAYGQHLVRLRSVSDKDRPPLDTVRDQLVADWREANAKASADAATAEMMERYSVKIEQP